MATLFDRAHSQGIGFSHCVSVGNQADLELCDFVEMLIEDDKTQVICTYIEGIKSPGRFVDLARRARLAGKPWLAVKAGKTTAGSQAAFSHTASMAGDFSTLAAVCKHENVILMDDPAAMLLLAFAMARYPGRKVDQAVIITTSGGGGALAADRLSEAGIPLAQFASSTAAALGEFYSDGQAQNPIDTGGRKYEVAANSADVAERTASIALSDPHVDMGLVVLTTAPLLASVAEAMSVGAAGSEKPWLYVMQPGKAADAARAVLLKHSMPYTNALSEAVEAIAAWRVWSAHQEPGAVARPSDISHVAILPGTRSEFESKKILQSVGIPVNQECIVASIDEALLAARAMTFPLVLKVASPDIVHKSDVGGVRLGLRDEAELKGALEQMRDGIARALPQARIDGYTLQAMESGELELILGARRDSQFGPQVMIGSGGVLVELLKDFTVLPAPIDHGQAIRALQALKIAPLLAAYRGRAALDIQAVADALVRLSWLAHDMSESDFEIEINPLKVRIEGHGCVAVDARASVA
jgi:acetyl-CoA synthetase (ADP-forming)